MLYYPFREVVAQLTAALGDLIAVATPSPDEWNNDVKTLLPQLQAAQHKLAASLQQLPETLEPFKDRPAGFGPIVQRSDICFVLEAVAALASNPQLPRALYSYNPAKLYRCGTLFTACVIELYWGQQKYQAARYPTRPGEIPALLGDISWSCQVRLDDLLRVQEEFTHALQARAQTDIHESASL